MEAFSDAVVAGEAPHASDLVASGIERLAESDQWREPATTERGYVAQEARRQTPAFLSSVMFLQQQVSEPLFKAVDRFQSWSLPEVKSETGVLFGAQVMPVPSHRRDQTAVL